MPQHFEEKTGGISGIFRRSSTWSLPPPVFEYFFPRAGRVDFLPRYMVRAVSGPKCARSHKGKAAQTAATELGFCERLGRYGTSRNSVWVWEGNSQTAKTICICGVHSENCRPLPWVNNSALQSAGSSQTLVQNWCYNAVAYLQSRERGSHVFGYVKHIPLGQSFRWGTGHCTRFHISLHSEHYRIISSYTVFRQEPRGAKEYDISA